MKLKTNLGILFIAILFFTGCKTKSLTKETVSIQEWEPVEKSLLWEVEKNGFNTSYLFGTIHIIDKNDYFLPDGFKAAFNKVDQVVYEIDIASMEDMSTQMGLLTKAFMSGNQTLSDLMPEEDYKLVSEHFSEMGLPMMFLDRIKPMFLSILGGGDMSPDMLTSGEFVSYEFEINTLAEESKKETGGLETIEYQMSLFDSIPYSAQADMLVESIKNSGDDGEDMLSELTKLYKSKDLKQMHDYTLADESGMEIFSDVLLYQRNTNWIPLMKDMMKEKSVLFAVGAGHLGGTKGVLALLKKNGFEVTPIL